MRVFLKMKETLMREFDARRAATLALACALVFASLWSPASAAQQSAGDGAKGAKQATDAGRSAGPASGDISEAQRLVTEFDVNGLKVLVKRREGSQTVVAGLFLKGGARNVTAENAGVESLMLDTA